ncbi:MAG TPA: ribonuclease HII [Candidatus Paceibacterota bacterium]
MKYIVGIDEVGRGPLAGPVTVCVVACEVGVYTKLLRNKNFPPLGKDSKKLKEFDREKYAKVLKSLVSKSLFDTSPRVPLGQGFSYSIHHVSNKIIDSKGISFAIRLAIDRGITKLKLRPKDCRVLLDGGLRLPKEFKKQKTIIKGDEKEKIIAWASILAKVSRDGLMRKLAKKYPKYGFEIHKGYGTEKHIKAMRKYGLSPVHRRSFSGKY